MKVVGIAGGSGAGKSSIAYSLVDAEPSKFEVLNFDDYQMCGRPEIKAELPRIDGIINWDHPDVIDWAALRTDVRTLREGSPITVETWAHRTNPDYAIHRIKLARLVLPKPILLVEGYMALNERIIDIYDQAFYLDLDETTRDARRRQARGGVDNINGEDGYTEKILTPMFKEHVEPTKKLADVVIDVANKTTLEVTDIVRNSLF